ncbi:unnamed protein product [Rhizophagus irregularis]|uniref:Uncharacterized protein n=1 Tax=Rhizophagus irregularis TaxID=588596 RepID=A0A915YWH7_9GLOM|nr:unnamed protein product [Rhizophagus irregularis]
MYCDSDDLGSDLLNHTIKDEKKISPFEPEPVKIDDEAENNQERNHFRPTIQFEVVGEEASGRVDYAIKKVIDVVNEELIAITEEGFGKAFDSFDESSTTSMRSLLQHLTENDEELRRGVKKSYESDCEFVEG